jgi:hypothetical protein
MLAPLVIHSTAPKSYACRIAVGWNPHLARIHPVAHPKRVERGASTVSAKLFNRASQVIIARNGNNTILTMANDFQGDVKDFAMVVPVPVGN